MKEHLYYVYIITNPSKIALYVGVTNNLAARLHEHYLQRGNEYTWAGKYYCYNLIYYKEYEYIDKAMAREKQIRRWSRSKKEFLINTKNSQWHVLNGNFKYDPDEGKRF